MNARFAWFLISAAASAWAQPLQVWLDAAQFWHNRQVPRWELYYSFPDTTVRLRHTDSGDVGELYFGVQIDSAGRPVAFREWIVPVLHTAPRGDTARELIGQQHFLLPPGNYAVRILIQDVADSSRRAQARFALSVRPFDSTRLELSDIQLASLIRYHPTPEAAPESPFRKGAYTIIPNPSVEYRGSDPVLRLYVELYNARRRTPEGGTLRYELLDASGTRLWELERPYRPVADALADVLELPINVIPSGVYFIRVQARTSADSASAQKRFYVLNPELPPQPLAAHTPEDSLFEASEFATYSPSRVAQELELLELLASPQELELARSLTELRARQRFLFRFWSARDPNPATPENEALQDFRARLEYANTYFASARWRTGWRSDRGRVLLKYGYPTQRETITATPDQRSYEVWFYAGLRGGAYFYFVDLTGFQDYTLVHSTVPGEPYAPDWQTRYLPLGPSGR